MSRHNSPTRTLALGLVLATGLVLISAANAHAQPQVFTSGDAGVTTWNAIIPTTEYSDWGTRVCKATPDIDLDSPLWVNPHAPFTTFTPIWPHVPATHPWVANFNAKWINAWGNLASNKAAPNVGPAGHNWTKYSLPVSGDGNFQLQLVADNCSWIYVDGVLVGFQGSSSKFPVVLNSTQLGRPQMLEFLIFDGGGLAGGMFRLETTTDQTLFKDTDGDGLADVAEEQLHGTNKNNPDTDGDSISDGDEVEAGTNPLVFNVPADTTPPVITPTVTGSSNGSWYTSDVTVDWSVTDGESAITSAPCASSVVTTDTAGTTFTCSATSGGGTSTQSVTIQRDTTPPVLVPTVSGTESNGWYTSNVTISWSVTDSLSPLTANGCSTSTVTADTNGSTFTCSATSAGGTSSQSVTVRRDTTGPVIASVTTNAPALWPPNHTMHTIVVTPGTSDAGAGGVVCTIDGVTSNEGGNQHEPDVQLTGPLTVNLRAERNGNNTSRIYTIQVSCKDTVGNKSTGMTTVVVPHDQGKKK